jgi:3-dehydrosphinganine reductase
MANNSNNSYQGRVALITGGSSGLGLALAQLLAGEGANVWLLARRKELLESARKTLSSANGQKHGMYVADVTEREQVQSAVRRFQQEVGVPDLLINCAGAAHPGYVQEIPLEVFDEMMNLNYFGTVNMVKAVLPAMLQRGSGYIVNISSAAAYLGVFGYSAYGASKYAVRGFSDVLRGEAKPLGVGVSVVFPPDMDTPGLANENKTKPFETHEIEGNAGVFPAEKVAKDILDGVKRGRYVIVPGLQNTIFYRLSSLVGNGVYPIMDAMIADARKKKLRR